MILNNIHNQLIKISIFKEAVIPWIIKSEIMIMIKILKSKNVKTVYL